MSAGTETCKLCGRPADPELVELAMTFPLLVNPARCVACDLAEKETERRERIKLVSEQEEGRRLALVASTIPPEIARTSISHPKFNAGLWTRIETWHPRNLEWLGIVGIPGTCKTRCLGLLVRRLILEGIPVTWTSAVEFQDAVEDLASRSRTVSARARAVLDGCKSAAVWLLDDLGKNEWNSAIERHLFRVIDHRKTHDLPVLWSANTSLREMLATGHLTRERGGPLLGRIQEASRIESA